MRKCEDNFSFPNKIEILKKNITSFQYFFKYFNSSTHSYCYNNNIYLGIFDIQYNFLINVYNFYLTYLQLLDTLALFQIILVAILNYVYL